jgi:putative ABC transport system substrate-binding protein
MRRRAFLTLAAGALASRQAWAEPAQTVRKIGILGDVGAKQAKAACNWLSAGLQDRGWVVGRNVICLPRFTEGKAEGYPALAEELVRLNMDVIIAPSEDGALAAKAATRMIPIVMIYPLNPIRIGLIESYAHPGGNVTGLTYEAGSTFVGKQLELLKEAVPGLSRLAVLWNPASEQSERWLEELRIPAQTLQMDIVAVGASSPEEFKLAFAKMSKERAGALDILTDPMFYLHRAKLIELALRNRLPTISALYRFPHAGGLMSYEVDIPDLYARAAVYVDKLLRGADPAELPVEQPTKFILTVNLKTAKAIGLSVPQSLLLRADRVIE